MKNLMTAVISISGSARGKIWCLCAALLVGMSGRGFCLETGPEEVRAGAGILFGEMTGKGNAGNQPAFAGSAPEATASDASAYQERALISGAVSGDKESVKTKSGGGLGLQKAGIPALAAPRSEETGKSSDINKGRGILSEAVDGIKPLWGAGLVVAAFAVAGALLGAAASAPVAGIVAAALIGVVVVRLAAIASDQMSR